MAKIKIITDFLLVFCLNNTFWRQILNLDDECYIKIFLGNSEEEDDKRTTSTYSTNSSEESRQPSGNYFAGNLFKCNLCEIAFAENAFLLTHLKNRHRSTVSKALKPHFSCGACPAKFFKNSFLVKHVECHGFDPSSLQRLRQ